MICKSIYWINKVIMCLGSAATKKSRELVCWEISMEVMCIIYLN